MDVTLIPESESEYDKKNKKFVLTDKGILTLMDCSLLLLHKCGMRPLFLLRNEKEEILLKPKHKIMCEPDLILHDRTETGVKSAELIKEQLEKVAFNPCTVNSNFSFLKRISDPELLKKFISNKISQLEQKGYKHVVFLSSPDVLDKLAIFFNGKGLNPNYNIPIYSFSENQEILDKNLTDNFYVTREFLDHCLVRIINHTDQFHQYKGKCYPIQELYQLKQKLKTK